MLSSVNLILFQASLLPGIGPRTLERLIPNAQTCVDIFELAEKDVRLKKRLVENPGIVKEAYEEIERASLADVRIIARDEPSYPVNLSGTQDAPYFLFVKGNIATLNEKVVAIIGSRVATSRVLEISRRLSAFCCSKGYVALSGLADGCDWAVHEGALECAGKTIAVLPHGLSFRTSARRQKLMDKIVSENGALVSQFFPNAAPNKGNFVIRDRVQAGLSALTILVQSKTDGGSLHACRASLEYKRQLGFVAPSVSDEISANRVLMNKDWKPISEMLNCSQSDCSRIFEIEGKQDYIKIEEFVARHSSESY